MMYSTFILLVLCFARLATSRPGAIESQKRSDGYDLDDLSTEEKFRAGLSKDQLSDITITGNGVYNGFEETGYGFDSDEKEGLDKGEAEYNIPKPGIAQPLNTSVQNQICTKAVSAMSKRSAENDMVKSESRAIIHYVINYCMHLPGGAEKETLQTSPRPAYTNLDGEIDLIDFAFFLMDTYIDDLPSEFLNAIFDLAVELDAAKNRPTQTTAYVDQSNEIPEIHEQDTELLKRSDGEQLIQSGESVKQENSGSALGVVISSLARGIGEVESVQREEQNSMSGLGAIIRSTGHRTKS